MQQHNMTSGVTIRGVDKVSIVGWSQPVDDSIRVEVAIRGVDIRLSILYIYTKRTVRLI